MLSSTSTSHRCSISSSPLAAVTWIRNPTSSFGTRGYAAMRHVDAAVEEEATDRVDVLVAGERYLDHRVARLVRRVDAELVEAAENAGGSCGASRCAARSPRLSLTSQPDERRRQRRDRGGAGVQVRRRGDLQDVLEARRQREEREQRAVRLAEAGDEDHVVVALAVMPDDPVATGAPVAQLERIPLTDDAEAVRVVDVEERVVVTRRRVRTRATSGAFPVIEFTPSIAMTRGVALDALEELFEVLGVVVPEPHDRRAVAAGDHRTVVDRLVRASVEEDHARAGEDRDHRHVDVRDRRQQQRVLAAEQVGELGLDLLVDHRAPEQPRPARVGAPTREVVRGWRR